MDLNEVIAAISNPGGSPHQPEGDPNAQPLQPLGLDRVGGEPFPAQISPAQGAGTGSGGLTPGASGSAGDGTVEPGNDDHYSSQGGPVILPAVKGLAALTPGYNGRPEGGETLLGEPAGDPTPGRLGPSGDGQTPGHPALKVVTKNL